MTFKTIVKLDLRFLIDFNSYSQNTAVNRSFSKQDICSSKLQPPEDLVSQRATKEAADREREIFSSNFRKKMKEFKSREMKSKN